MRREQSIAVLPFVNLSPFSEDDLFCDGLTEEVINALARIRYAFVTSRTSSFHFKNHNKEISEIASKLGVQFIVEGSFRRSGEKIRITVQLINAKEDYHYWSENFDRTFEDIFQIQDEIALAVKEKFRELIGHFEINEEIDNPIGRSVKAYELIQKAKREASDISKEGVNKGLHLIDQAIEIEPGNATFHATRATYLAALGIMGAMNMNEASNLAIESSSYALELDPNNAEAHAISGHLAFALNGNIPKFRLHVNKARELKHSEIFSLYFISIVDSAIGNYESSMEALDLAEEIDPLSQMPHYLRAINLMRLGYHELAIETAEYFLRAFPNHINAYNVMGQALLRSGKPKIALAHFTKMPMADGSKLPYYGGMAMAFAMMGNISDAEEHLDLAINEDNRLHLSYKENPEVMVNLLLARFNEGFKHLEKDIKSGEWYTKFYLTNPLFDPIRIGPHAKIFNGILTFEKEDAILETSSKYSKSGLTDTEVKSWAKELTKYMEEEKPFLNPELSLKTLAKSMDLSANHLSQVINSSENKNFFDYINSYRIKELLRLLNEHKNEKFTILSLAMDAGFNSKSTFNASFKKLTGYTPTEYLKKVEITQ